MYRISREMTRIDPKYIRDFANVARKDRLIEQPIETLASDDELMRRFLDFLWL